MLVHETIPETALKNQEYICIEYIFTFVLWKAGKTASHFYSLKDTF